MNKDQWDPEFLKAIPIMKTRSGMQVRTGNIFGTMSVYCMFYQSNAVCFEESETHVSIS